MGRMAVTPPSWAFQTDRQAMRETMTPVERGAPPFHRSGPAHRSPAHGHPLHLPRMRLSRYDFIAIMMKWVSGKDHLGSTPPPPAVQCVAANRQKSLSPALMLHNNGFLFFWPKVSWRTLVTIRYLRQRLGIQVQSGPVLR